MKLIVEVPLNSLSFGNVSVNLLREMYKREYDVALFPIGDKAELEAYDKIDKEFVEWIQACANSRFDKINKDTPTLKLWHINGALESFSNDQLLMTFYELNDLTPAERNALLNNRVAVTSSYTKEIFESVGLCADFVPLGFDKYLVQVVIKKYAKNSSFFIQLSNFEGMAMSVSESMQLGLIPIVTILSPLLAIWSAVLIALTNCW